MSGDCKHLSGFELTGLVTPTGIVQCRDCGMRMTPGEAAIYKKLCFMDEYARGVPQSIPVYFPSAKDAP